MGISAGTWSRQIRTDTTRTRNGRKRFAHAQRRKRPAQIMVLRSKRESRRTRKPEISIYSETSASGERTRLACRSRRLAAKYPSGIRHLTRDVRPVDWRGRQSQVAAATAPRKIACANAVIVTSYAADEQLRAFTNSRARSYCKRSVCSVFLDTSRQRLAAIARMHSR